MKYKKRTNLSTQTTDDGIMILDKNSGSIHHLNAIAAFIWNNIELSHAEIVHSITQEYDVNIQTATDDMMTIIQQLVKHKLIVQDAQKYVGQ